MRWVWHQMTERLPFTCAVKASHLFLNKSCWKRPDDNEKDSILIRYRKISYVSCFGTTKIAVAKILSHLACLCFLTASGWQWTFYDVTCDFYLLFWLLQEILHITCYFVFYVFTMFSWMLIYDYQKHTNNVRYRGFLVKLLC